VSAAERAFYRNRPLFGLDGRTALIHASDCNRLSLLRANPVVARVGRVSARRAALVSGLSLVGALLRVRP